MNFFKIDAPDFELMSEDTLWSFEDQESKQDWLTITFSSVVSKEPVVFRPKKACLVYQGNLVYLLTFSESYDFRRTRYLSDLPLSDPYQILSGRVTKTFQDGQKILVQEVRIEYDRGAKEFLTNVTFYVTFHLLEEKKQEQIVTFEHELESLLNRYSKENDSDTPDFILATYLLDCLRSFNAALVRREVWYGRSRPGTVQEGQVILEFPE